MIFFSQNRRGEGFAILSGLFFGLIGYFGIQIIQENFSIANMLCWRFLVSASFIACLLFPQRHLLKQNVLTMKKVALCGAFFFCTMSILYFMASRYVGTGLAMVIFFTYPSMVMLLNWLLYRTRVTKLYYMATLIIFLGMTLLVDMHELTFDLIGIALGLLSALSYACYILFTKNNPLPPLVSTFLMSAGGCLLCGLLAVLSHSFTVPNTFSLSFNIISMGILCTALPILFLLQGLKYISAQKVSILSVFEPIFVVIFGVILLGEHVSSSHVLGIIIILAGALITLFSQEAPSQAAQPVAEISP